MKMKIISWIKRRVPVSGKGHLDKTGKSLKSGKNKRAKISVGKSPAKSVSNKRPQLKQQLLGRVTHYFPKAQAAIIKITKGSLSLGDLLYIKGYTTDFQQVVSSIQINGRPVRKGLKGQEIGVLVRSRVRDGDLVYKISGSASRP
jgi:putative protease